MIFQSNINNAGSSKRPLPGIPGNNNLKKVKISMLLLITTLFITLSFQQAPCQTLVKVVSKKIERSFPFKSDFELNIEGEKAEVSIQTWDKKEVKIVLELIAKHPDAAVAERDLGNMHYLAERIKNKIYLRNYLKTEADTPPNESLLSARYTILVPEECPVYLKNQYGTISAQNLTNRLSIKSEFSSVGLQDIKGFLDMYSRFGDIFAERLNADVSLHTRRSDITLKEMSGRYNITSYYGVLNLFATADLLDLNIDAEKSDVNFYHPNPKSLGYVVAANYGGFNFPTDLRVKMLENTPAMKKYEFRPSTEIGATVSIKITFGEVNIEKR